MRSFYTLGVAGGLAMLTSSAFAQLAVPTLANTLTVAGATSTEPLVAAAFLDATRGLCAPIAPAGVTAVNQAPVANEANVYTTENSFGAAGSGATGTSTLYANFAIVCVGSAQATGLVGATFQVIKNTGSSATALNNVGPGTAYADNAAGDAHWAAAVAGNTAALAGCSNNGVALAYQAGGLTTALNLPDQNQNRINYTVYTGCGINGGAGGLIPNVGITDVEGTQFIPVNGATQAQLNQTTQYPTAGLGWIDVPFAPIVSIPFYRALQAAQLTGAQLAACQANAGPGPSAGYPSIALQTEACVPSLSRTQITAILTGSSPYLAATGFPNLTAPADNSIYFCERTAKSGTQAAFRMYFLGNGCTPSAPTMQVADATFDNGVDFACGNLPVNPANTTTCKTNRNIPDSNGAGYVWQNQTTPGVRLCVANRTSAGDPFGLATDQWAVGIISLDQIPDDTFNGQFRYVKVDGITPTLENIVRGSWNLWEEDFLQIPGPTSPQATLTATQTAAYKAMSAVVQNVNQASLAATQMAYGLQGYLERPGGALVPQQGGVTTTNVKNNPVNSSVKALTSASSTNNCLYPNAIFNEDALATQ